ncbi:hypothetical protein [Lichenicoccus sp.]|uniref:hypothetical protein n=1 Tax=Lichenicoccus sp. TaxID=2781899 RepID=UPI003D0AA82A
MGRSAAPVAWLIACIALLLWPALLNGYPLVFADSGTYLSQAIRHYLGWDRPAVYSVFLLITHWKLTNWSSVVVQAMMVLYGLDLLRRSFTPDVPRWLLLPMIAAFCLVTPLPWFVGQLMPDLFTSLLTLVIAVLVLRPESVSRVEIIGLALFAAWMTASHLSNVWIATGLAIILVPVRHLLLRGERLGWHGVRRVAAPIALAVFVLCTINLAAFRRFTISPFGNVFLLARLIYDGPGELTLQQDCPASGWRLCAYTDALPPHPTRFPNSDYFLWQPHGPLAQLGGAKRLSTEAGQIILRTIREHPLAVTESGTYNFLRQLLRFKTGDGLHAWRGEVRPIIASSFPARELRAFDLSLQSRGKVRVPAWLQWLHDAGFWAGLAATLYCFVVALRERQPLALLCAAVLLCLLGNAAVTGMLSGPHDRYQSRVIWLVWVTPMLLVCRAWATQPESAKVAPLAIPEVSGPIAE